MGYPPVGKGRGGSSGRPIPGTPGSPGRDGVTPHIGVNGNWFIGTKDTGVSARGESDGRAIIAVSQQGNTLTFQHADGAKHAISITPGTPTDPTGLTDEIKKAEASITSEGHDIDALKAQVGQLSHHVDSMLGVFSYRGTVPPTAYPTELKSANFINLHDSKGHQSMVMPDQQGLSNDGTVFFLNNENDSSTVTVNAVYGIPIDNAANMIVGPGQFHMLVKHGNEWITAATGYIPSSLDDITNRVAATMTPQLHTTPQINDIINQWIANPHNQGTLDKIMTDLGYTKGGGHSGGGTPHPSTVKLHYGTGDDYPTTFAGEIGEVSTSQPMVVNHLDQNPKHVWIAVPTSRKDKVVGIVANSGMPAEWASKDVTINLEQWTLFLSPTPLADDSVKFTIRWSV